MAKRKAQPKSSSGSAPFAYEGLDRVIHEKARLGIMTSLASQTDGLSFTDLKSLCGLTDGNLNRHLEVLNEAKLVQVHKNRGEGRARTHCAITAKGRKQFLTYLAELERVVADASAAQAAAKKITKGGLSFA